MKRERRCRKCGELVPTGRSWCLVCLLELVQLGERRRLAAMGVMQTVLGRVRG